MVNGIPCRQITSVRSAIGWETHVHIADGLSTDRERKSPCQGRLVIARYDFGQGCA